MTDFLKKMRPGSVLGFVLCIIFGAIICIWPGTVLILLCRIAGALILAFGIYSIVLCGQKSTVSTVLKSFQMMAGIVMCVLGIWILFIPGFFLHMIPVVIGIVLIYHGIKNIMISSQVYEPNSQKRTAGFILAVITIVLGAVMIVGASFFLRLGMVAAGIFLIYDGIFGLWMIYRGGGPKDGDDDFIDIDYKEM